MDFSPFSPPLYNIFPPGRKRLQDATTRRLTKKTAEGYTEFNEKERRDYSMYERMLDKQHCPSLEEMSAFCEENARRFDEINALLQDEFQTETAPAFPYGNHYG